MSGEAGPPDRRARPAGDGGGTAPSPLTLGTAGHIDHGKTALVGALTGRDTDRLPQEKARGISIELGYAPLELPSGRRLSVVDVPGHERFVRTMVAGATGIDLYLMTVAADDGVMPQTREHAAVLAGLGIEAGVVAVTKADLADPAPAAAQARDLLPGAEVLAVSARTGEGLDELRAALDRAAGRLPGRAGAGGPARLHVDRVFTIKGIGTVVTGTLWSGAIARGDEVAVLPGGLRARVRSVQVHDEPVGRARAGQRVALNLAGLAVREAARGDVVAGPEAALAPAFFLDVALDERARRPEHGERLQVHHGTREAPGRVAELGGRFWQLRLEAPLIAARGDRVVLRRIAPPDTLGGAAVLDSHARKHGPTRDALARLERLARGEEGEAAGGDGGAAGSARRVKPAAAREESPPPLTPAALLLEDRLRAAGAEPPAHAELGEDAAHLPALRAHGRSVRVGRALDFHPGALEDVRRRLVARIERTGSVSLAELRDELGTTRRFAQALLEHFDGERLTLRRPDDRRVLRRRSGR